MPTRELPDSAPGKYVPFHPNPYYAPEPLPVEPKLEIPDQIRNLVADTAYQIGRIDGISSTVDFSAVLYFQGKDSIQRSQPKSSKLRGGLHTRRETVRG